MTKTTPAPMPPARVLFTRATGWEADYVLRARVGTTAGYRGPFPREGREAQRLAGLVQSFCRNRRATDVFVGKLRSSDRVVILWGRRKPMAIVAATFVRCGGHTGWHLTVGEVAPEFRGRDLLRNVIDSVLREEPVDFVSSGLSKGNRAAPLDTLRQLSPTRTASADLNVLAAWGLRSLPDEVAGFDNGTGESRGSTTEGHVGGSVTSELTNGDLAVTSLKTGDLAARELQTGKRQIGNVAVADLSGRLTAAGRLASADGPRRGANQSITKIAITGTNGKTSCVELGRQLMTACGQEAASFGTLGITTSRGRNRDGRIGPGARGLPRLAERLWAIGVQSIWAEAFSNALRKGLLDHFPVDIAIFTQLGVDHISVHGSLASYWAAKERLFTSVLSSDGVVVLNPSAHGAGRVMAIAEERGIRVVTTGPGNMIELGVNVVTIHGQRFDAELPFLEEVMVRNLELVIGAAIEAGLNSEEVVANLSALEFPPGRFMEVGVDTDYRLVIEAAHNGDALEVSLNHWRRQTSGRLLVLLASVGSSDPERWEPLGEVADVLGDVVVVTDESPYGNNADRIRSALRRGCPRALDIPDRTQAIAWLLDQAEPDDIVMLMGRADEAFVVGKSGSVAFPTDEALVRAHLG